jgi:hypothetical protein
MSNRRWRRPVRYSLGRRSKQHDLITGVAVLGCVFLAVGAAVGIGAATSGGSGRRSAAATISTPNSFTTSTTMTVTQVADQNETQTWSAEISKDFADLDSVLEPLLQSTESWERGSAVSRSTGPPATGSAVAAEIAGYWPDFSDTRGALAKQAPLALARQALNDYQMSVDLYVESVRLVLLTTHLPAGPLQHQLQLSSTRIRELGDRVYDQATAVLAPFTAPTAPTPRRHDSGASRRSALGVDRTGRRAAARLHVTNPEAHLLPGHPTPGIIRQVEGGDRAGGHPVRDCGGQRDRGTARCRY